MFERSIIQSIIDSWNRMTGEVDSLKQPAPDFNHVKLLMESVFMASMQREEDTPVRISVSLLRPGYISPQNQVHGNFIVSFKTKIPLSVQSLVKLAAAFDPSTTSLAVYPDDDSSESLYIWGLVFSSQRGRSGLDFVSSYYPSPDALTISATSPGSLLISRSDRIIDRFSSGEFIHPIPTPFTSIYLGQYFIKTVETHSGYERVGVTYWHHYRDFLDYLLVESSNRGHGGTIIWLPEQTITGAEELIEPRNILTDSPDGSKLLTDLCWLKSQIDSHVRELVAKPGEEAILSDSGSREGSLEVLAEHEFLLRAKKRVVEYAEFLAQLTCVDGALVLSDSMKALCFGSFLTASAWQGKVLKPVDRSSKKFSDVDLSKYGTRHNSAVNFVGKCPGSIAFVISQDGPIAGLTKLEDDLVFWWPDCLSSLWISRTTKSLP